MDLEGRHENDAGTVADRRFLRGCGRPPNIVLGHVNLSRARRDMNQIQHPKERQQASPPACSSDSSGRARRDLSGYPIALKLRARSCDDRYPWQGNHRG